MYYRQGGMRFDTDDGTGTKLSAGNVDPAMRDRAVEAGGKVTGPMVDMDTAAMFDFTAAGEPVHPGPVGVIGYCLGGRLALLAAGYHPERVRASASLHGAVLVTDDDDSAHLMADRIEGEFYFGYAEKDPFASPEVRATLEKVMTPAGVDYRYCFHEGIDHGYALPERDIHDRHAAARDWENIFAMFRRQMPPGG